MVPGEMQRLCEELRQINASPTLAQVFGLQYQVGHQRLVFKVRLMLDGVPQLALLLAHVLAVFRCARHFDVVGEQLRTEIRTVAEGLQGFREVTTAEFKAVRGEIAETQAMIRLSFGELDRRIRP